MHLLQEFEYSTTQPKKNPECFGKIKRLLLHMLCHFLFLSVCCNILQHLNMTLCMCLTPVLQCQQRHRIVKV